MNLGKRTVGFWAAVATLVAAAASLPACAADSVPGTAAGKTATTEASRPAPFAAARGNTSGKANASLRVTRIDVVHGKDGIAIEITGSSPLRTSTLRLSAPERFVVDVEDAIYTGDQLKIKVGAGDIRSLRVGRHYQQEVPVTRIVVDLAKPREMEVMSAGNKLRVRVQHADTTQNAVLARSIPPMPSPAASGMAMANSAPAPVPIPILPAEDWARSEPAGETKTAFVPEPQASPISGEEPALSTGINSPNTAPAPLISARGVGVGITGQADDPLLGHDAADDGTKRSKKQKADTSYGKNGEEQPPLALRLSGAATAGYYQAETSSTYVTRESSPVGNLALDGSGYFHSPEFLSFSVKPRESVGLQSSEGIFPDGRGVSATTTFLGGGAAPLTLSYSRLNRKLVTFGPTDRLAGLEANTFQDVAGLNWKVHLNNLPDLNLNFSKYSDSYEPLTDLAPKTTNDSRLLSADLAQKVLGWKLQWHSQLDRSAQDLINIFDPSQAPYLYRRKSQESRASVDRDFGEWLSLSFQGGDSKSHNEVQGRPFDQGFRFLTANSFLRSGKKLMFAFRAGVTDNLVGASLENVAGSTQPVPNEPLLLVPTQAKLQLVSYSGSVQYALTNDLRVNTDVTREVTRAPQGSGLITPGSSLTSLQAGVAYTRRFRFWQFQSYYGANGGRFDYQSMGASRSFGQRANLGASIGSLKSLEVAASLQGSLQDVTGNTFMRDRSWGATLTVSRTLFERWRLRTTYNRELDRYEFAATQFNSDGNGITFALIHPRVEISASHNVRDGLTFQADPRLQYVTSSQSILVLGAYPGTLIVPSGAMWDNAAVILRPVGKFTARGSWLRSRQQLQDTVSNYYTEWEFAAGYQFRALTLDAGYVLHHQAFGVDLFERNRFFFRIVREFTIF